MVLGAARISVANPRGVLTLAVCGTPFFGMLSTHCCATLATSGDHCTGGTPCMQRYLLNAATHRGGSLIGSGASAVCLRRREESGPCVVVVVVVLCLQSF